MCGIAAVLGEASAALHVDLEASLVRRGPEHVESIHIPASRLTLCAGVLHLRGDIMCRQPVQDLHGNVLVWNGEIFGGPMFIPVNVSDTLFLSNFLADATLGTTSSLEVVKTIQHVLRPLQGPYALCFYHHATRTFVYGRDPLGRRSLVVYNDAMNSLLIVASTAVHDRTLKPWTEVPCTGLFSICCHQYYDNATNHSFSPELTLWSASTPLQQISHCIPKNNDDNDLLLVALGCPSLPPGLDVISFDTLDPSLASSARGFLSVLSAAVGVRVASKSRPPPPYASSSFSQSPSPSMGVFFSGGLDSVVIAALAHFHLPTSEPIELFNICFDKKQVSPDRQAALIAAEELQRLYPAREWRFLEINVGYDEVTLATPHILQLMTPCETHMDFNIGTAFWFLSKGVGVMTIASNLRSRITPSSPTNATTTSFFDRDRPVFTSRNHSIEHMNNYHSDAIDNGASSNETQNIMQRILHTTSSSKTLCAASNSHRRCAKVARNCRFHMCRTCCVKVHKWGQQCMAPNAHPAQVHAARAQLMAILNVSAAILESQWHTFFPWAATEQQALPCCTEHTTTTSPCDAPPVIGTITGKTSSDVTTKTSEISDVASSFSSSSLTRLFCSTSKVLLVGIGADEQLGGNVVCIYIYICVCVCVNRGPFVCACIPMKDI
jgi:asparagine synthetase B (glutamine-hydrolysing)